MKRVIQVTLTKPELSLIVNALSTAAALSKQNSEHAARAVVNFQLTLLYHGVETYEDLQERLIRMAETLPNIKITSNKREGSRSAEGEENDR